MREKNQGITLIALIITIIIMLILVAVSISLALNSGLFKAAGKASQQWNTAQQEETEISEGKTQIGNEVYNAIGDYVGEITGTKEIHSWTRDGDTITCSHCSTTLTIGQEVNYIAGGTASTSISGEKSGVAQGIADGNLNASAFETNGNQTLSKDADTKWVVLGIEDSNEDGNRETLLLTTFAPTTDTIRLYGAAAYNNAIGEINRMCKELYGEDARGMTIEDVNNCLGYTPTGGMYYDGSTYKTTGNFTTKLSELEIWPNIQSYKETNKEGKYYTPEYPEGTTDASKLGNYLLDGYLYQVDSSVSSRSGVPIVPAETSNIAKNLVFGNPNIYANWLASRGIVAYNSYVVFELGYVYFGFAGISKSYPHFYISVKGSADYPIRAVVSLRSEIPEGGEVIVSSNEWSRPVN